MNIQKIFRDEVNGQEVNLNDVCTKQLKITEAVGQWKGDFAGNC